MTATHDADSLIKNNQKVWMKKNYVIVTQKLHLAVHKTLIALASTLILIWLQNIFCSQIKVLELQ